MHLPRIFASKISSFIYEFIKIHEDGDESSHSLLQTKNGKTSASQRQGYVTVYVGKGSKKYKVPVEYLSFPEFTELIKNSLDGELDIKIDGPIKFDCISTKKFDQFLKNIQKHGCKLQQPD